MLWRYQFTNTKSMLIVKAQSKQKNYVSDFYLSSGDHKCLDFLLSNPTMKLQPSSSKLLPQNLLNEPDENGETVLHMAAYHHNYKLVERFISLGADVNCRDDQGSTPLHKLSHNRNRLNSQEDLDKCREILMLCDQIDLYAKNREGIVAKDANSFATDGEINRHGQNSNEDEEKKRAIRPLMSKIHDALFSKNTILELREFVDNFDNSFENSLRNQYVGSRSLIYTIVSLLDKEFVENFLAIGCDPWQENVDGEMAIELAITEGNLHVLDMLIESMKTTKCQDYIDLRIYSFHYLNIILSEAEQNSTKDMSNTTDYNKCLSRLLQNDVLLDIDARDKEGQNALQVAAIVSNQDAMRMLLTKGAYVGIKRKIKDDEEAGGILGAMVPSTLEMAVNDCIHVHQTSKYSPTDVVHPLFSLELDFSLLLKSSEETTEPHNFFNTNNTCYHVAETVLDIGEDINHQNCLQLPVMEALLDSKWNTIYDMIILNAFITSLFLLLLITQCILVNVSLEGDLYYNTTMNTISCFMMPLSFFLLIRELLEVFTSFKSYFRRIENYFEWYLIVSSVVLSFVEVKGKTAVHLTAWTTVIAL